MTTVYDWAVDLHDLDGTYVRPDVDGDTLDLTMRGESPGFGIGGAVFRARFRLVGRDGAWFDAWEKGDALGPMARALTAQWTVEAYERGVLRAVTHKPRSSTPLPDGAFGRWLADLYRLDTGVHLAQYLTDRGAAKVVTP